MIDIHELDPETKMFERVSETKQKAAAQQVSPIVHVSTDDPPTLIFHGDKDALVPIQQSESIIARLKEVKVPAELHVKSGAGHGWGDSAKDMEIAADWFDKYLPK